MTFSIKKIENTHNPAAVAAGSIEKSEGKANIKSISDTLNVNIRTLERNFKRIVGITPKEFSRVIRFNEMFNAINTGAGDIHGLIFECGYYDQAQLINEFQRFSLRIPEKG